MGPRPLGPVLLPLLIGAAAAANETVPASPVPFFQNNFTLFILGVLVLCVFVIIVARLFKGSDQQLSRFFVVKALGTALGLAFLIIGSVFLVSAVLILVTIMGNTDIFDWALYEMTPMFEWILEITYPVISILPIGVSTRTLILLFLVVGGFFLFFVGLYLLITSREGMFYTKKGTPTKSRFTTFREVMTRGTEPLNPTITFRVVDRDTGQPAPDVKVLLREKEGERVYSKYTDFNGEVVFQKIQGTYSTYYSFVEGDEDRAKYRVIRTSVGAGTETE
ncbi:MAG: hypothetical protein LUQ64_04795 [Methanomicrobiales archaeon]|nr:hypothetical protein [Methanomicrobiales archaeon]